MTNDREKISRTKMTVRPVYKLTLAAAIVIYIVGSLILQVDLVQRVGHLEHLLIHDPGHH